jgi:sialate O-acetylesterase
VDLAHHAGGGQVQLVEAAVDEHAARVEHGAHGAVGHQDTAGKLLSKLLCAAWVWDVPILPQAGRGVFQYQVMRFSCRFLALAACLLPAAVWADVKLPALLSDHMLLQQGAPVRVWGWAAPGEAVTVSFRNQKAAARAGQDGKWAAWLKPLEVGEPSAMTIAGNNTITIQDVLVGEVWVGSGQSNMGMTVKSSKDAEQEMAAANYPRIRLFTVKTTVAGEPLEDVQGSWKLCAPDTVGPFSAALYFFGRDLHKQRGTPMGLIFSAWGGTPAQSWASMPALLAEPPLKFILDDWQKTLANYPAAKEKFDKQVAAGTKPAPRPPAGPGHQNTPAGLYNAMIAPLTPFAIRGAIWYQGESNASPAHALPYRRLFRTMIEDWRHAWGIGDFPFLFVQLANFDSNTSWPVLRESQNKALGLANTGVAVAIDVGESKDIHPKNKQEVGRRLALAARHVAYGETLVYSGPLYRQSACEGDRMRVWFDSAEGLQARSGELTGFLIAGQDHKFVPAKAIIEDGTLVVSSPEVKEPAAVRYAWAADPAGANLVNGAGLPASPFRTDEWPE